MHERRVKKNKQVSLKKHLKFFKRRSERVKKSNIFYLFSAALILFQPLSVFSQTLDNKGTDFIMGFLKNYSTPNIELHLTSDVSTSVTINYPVNSPVFTTTVAVNPGAVTIVALPNSAAQSWGSGSVVNNCVRAFAEKEFVCYMINRSVFTSDAALALPVDTMNTEYIAMMYHPMFGGSEYVVVAAYNNTTVTITEPGQAPFVKVLQRGEGYSRKSSTITDLTGTIIESDKPVGFTNGNNCTQVPNGTCYCDHIFEVAQPVQSWGSDILVGNLPLRVKGSIYRILASADNTEIFIDGISQGIINRGEFIETAQLTGGHVISGDYPIFVTQFMTGVCLAGNSTGDPAMGNMIPADQYLSYYTFSTVGGSQFSQNWLNVIAENSDVGSLMLDGTAIPAASFSAIGTSGFSYATVQLSDGTHTTTSDGFHGITVEGYNAADSYIYPGGALFEFINPVGDANSPECGCDADGICTASDDRPSEDINANGVLDPGEDLNSNGMIDEDTGMFFVTLNPSVNLTLTVDPFVPGDGNVSYSVALTDSRLDGTGVITVTDGAGNTCSTRIALYGTGMCTDADDDGYAVEGGQCGPIDCNDNDTSINPGAEEICGNRIDEDCDKQADDCIDCIDRDLDGYGDGKDCIDADCNDNDTSINPGASEVCDNQMDDDCDGLVDDADPDCVQTWAQEIDFQVIPSNGSVTIKWTAISEDGVMGYNVLRAQDKSGTFKQINPDIISARGSIETTVDYEFSDSDVQNGRLYRYKLEELDVTGASKEHGPANAVPRLIYLLLGR